jgi:hypothetical protein
MKKLFSFLTASVLITSMALGQQTKKATTHTATKAAPAPFEGTIVFTQFNGTDTSYYEYYVKGNKVKVDNYDPKTKTIEGTFLIDLTTKKMTALSPVRKIYFDQPSGAPVKPTGTPQAVKTNNVKKINGYTCTEYVVVDGGESTKIHYWLAKGRFDFFVGMLQILNRKDKFSEYYLQIPAIQGMFPMLATQEDLAGNVKGSMKAEKMEKTQISDDTFSIPAGYKEFQK